MQIATLDIVSIVPGIRSAYTTLPTAVTSARDACPSGQIHQRRRSHRRNSADSAAPNRVHMAITPQAEKNVGARNSSASSASVGLVIHRPAT